MGPIEIKEIPRLRGAQDRYSDIIETARITADIERLSTVSK